MKLTEIMVILEVANHHQGEGKTAARLTKAIATLRRSAVAGCRVLYVFESLDEPAQVPCFDHNHKCRCENPQPCGVSRYFGFKVIVAGEPSANCFDIYMLTEHARLDFCGKCEPVEVEGFAPDLMISMPAQLHSQQSAHPTL